MVNLTLNLRRVRGWLLVGMLLCGASSHAAPAGAPLVFGVFDNLGQGQTALRYGPLVDYLNGALQGQRIELQVLSQAQLEAGIANRSLSFVSTTSAHFITVRGRYPLAGVIATLVTAEDGVPTSQYGGVVVRRRDRSELRHLSDVRGHTIAVASQNHMAWRAPAFELLQLGITLPRDARAVLETQTHEKALQAMLDGRADFAFVRTGILEKLSLNGMLDVSRLDVVEPRTAPGFRLLVSTRLYPEWPVFALPHVDERAVRQVASALYALEPEHPAAQAAGIHGFTTPADYLPVENLSRALRLPPYDHVPEFTFRDVLQRWRFEILGVCIALLAIGLLLARLWKLQHQADARQRLAVRVFETTNEAIVVTDADDTIVTVNPAFSRITGFMEREVVGKSHLSLLAQPQDKSFLHHMKLALREFGEWSGEVWSRRKNGELFPEWATMSSIRDKSERVTQYVSIYTDLSEIRRAEERAEQLASRDPLTGLANRTQFLKKLGESLDQLDRDHRFAGVLLLDIDRFKHVNEARGLVLGDALLKAVAALLRKNLHSDDVLARLSGDMFAVLPPRGMPSREAAGREALALAEKLRSVLKQHIRIDDEHFALDVSVGIALFPAPGCDHADEIMRQADTALHKAKAEGGARTTFFEVAMGDAVEQRFRVERELRLALVQDELRCHLQPQVSADGRLVGAEALIRWEHPQRGLVPPAVFIPIAEMSDLIAELDRWMLSQVCRLLVELDRRGQALRLSVNISPRHFQKPDFVESVRLLLSNSGADPSRLMLEVTEGLVMGDMADAVQKMSELSAMGLRFSMDDFGTGYSSLAYLKRLPISELKIDKSFVQDVTTNPQDAALVDTILAVARQLHLQVVAEGVETEAHAHFFDSRGDVVRQGYLYGRPEAAEIWMNRLGASSNQA